MKQPPRVKLLAQVAFLVIGLLLTACGEEPPPPPVRTTAVVRQPTIPPIPTLYEEAVKPTTTPLPTAPTQTRATTQLATNQPAPAQGQPDGPQLTQATTPPDLTLLANAQLAYLQGGDLWVSDERGGNRRQITQLGNIVPEKVYWSPLRDKVAIFDQREGIVMYDLTGRRLSLFRPDPTSQTLNSAAWSPDGRYLAFDMIFIGRNPDPRLPYSLATDGEIYLIDTQQDNSQRLNFGERPILPQRLASGFNFAWSPDGKQLAYPTHARRLELVENSTLPAPIVVYPGGTPGTAVGETPTRDPLTPRPLPGGDATPTGAAAAQALSPTPSSFPIVRPTRPATPTLRPGTILTPTPNPYYNPPQTLVPFENNLVVMTVADRHETIVAQSVTLPPYPSPEGNVYPTEATAFQIVSWSPDGRTLAFGDKLSYVGIVSLTGGSPRMLFGQPRAFAVNKLIWMPGSANSLMVLWNSFPGDDRTLMGVVTAPGIIGSAVSDKMTCPSLAPSGNMLAYLNGDDTMIIGLDGSTIGVLNGGGCPAWSPDGTLLATSRRGQDGVLVVTNPKGQVVRQMIGTRAVDQVFWFRPAQ